MSQEVLHIELLKEMISIPAISRMEHERSDFLNNYLREIGHKVTRINNNLLVGDPEIKDSRLRVLLNSHLDTVSPTEGWKSDPFVPQQEGDKLVGLGSNDAGASVVCLIAAYQKMAPLLKEYMNLMLLVSAEEEVSGVNGISSVLTELDHFDAAIVGEPTGMSPAVAERGLMVLDGEMSGSAGHAARNEGVNAIYKAVHDIGSISNLKFHNDSDWLPKPGAQVTMIEAGTGHNIVPDKCRFVVDVRSNDKYGNEAMLEILQSVCEVDLIPRSIRLHPSNLDPTHLLMKVISAIELEPFGSSTLSDMALIPFPAVKMGPGDSARSHTAGEFILKSELSKGIDGYCKFLAAMQELQLKNKVNS